MEKIEEGHENMHFQSANKARYIYSCPSIRGNLTVALCSNFVSIGIDFEHVFLYLTKYMRLPTCKPY